ncbi:MAG: TonB-dependent receptor [Myxococcota bacterium]
MASLTFAFLWIASAPVAAPGTATSSASPAVLPAVHVQGRRRFLDPTASSTERTRAELDASARRGEGLSSLLEGVPGATLTDEGGPVHARRLRLRGTSSAQTAVLLDGALLSSPFATGLDLGEFLIDDLDRVTVVRGVAGATAGDGAIGGAVYLNTRSAARADPAWAQLSAGSFGTLSAAGGLGVGQLRLSGRLEHSNGDFPYLSRIAGLPDEARQRRNNDATQGGGGLRWDRPLGEGRVDLWLSGALKDGGVPGLETQPSDSARERRGSGLLVARYTKRVRPDSPGFSASLHANALELNYQDPSQGSSHTTFWALGADTQLSVDAGSQRLRLGLSGGLQIADLDDARERSLFQSELFASDELSLGPFTFFLGLRGLIGDQGKDLLPRAGLRLEPKEWLALTLAVGRGRRPPTIDELYHPAENGVVGNAALIPERASEVELTAEAKIESLSLGASIFARDLDDAIAWIHQNAFTVRPENLGAARALGGELWAEARWELGPAALMVSLAGSLAATQSVVTQAALPGTPPWAFDGSIGLGLLGDPEARPLELYSRLHAAAGANANPTGTITIPGYLRWDAGLLGRLGDTLSAGLLITNLLDDRALVTLFKIPLPGRALLATLRISFGGAR